MNSSEVQKFTLRVLSLMRVYAYAAIFISAFIAPFVLSMSIAEGVLGVLPEEFFQLFVTNIAFSTMGASLAGAISIYRSLGKVAVTSRLYLNSLGILLAGYIAAIFSLVFIFSPGVGVDLRVSAFVLGIALYGFVLRLARFVFFRALQAGHHSSKLSGK